MLFSKFRGDLRKRAVLLLLAASIVTVLAPGTGAQSVAVAEVDGHITDPSGHSIVGAQVKMIEVGRQTSHPAATDVTGRYSLPRTCRFRLRIQSRNSACKPTP
jgi:hypothetical protein